MALIPTVVIRIYNVPAKKLYKFWLQIFKPDTYSITAQKLKFDDIKQLV